MAPAAVGAYRSAQTPTDQFSPWNSGEMLTKESGKSVEVLFFAAKICPGLRLRAGKAFPVKLVRVLGVHANAAFPTACVVTSVERGDPQGTYLLAKKNRSVQHSKFESVSVCEIQ